jgi:hypothetical protein
MQRFRHEAENIRYHIVLGLELFDSPPDSILGIDCVIDPSTICVSPAARRGEIFKQRRQLGSQAGRERPRRANDPENRSQIVIYIRVDLSVAHVYAREA